MRFVDQEEKRWKMHKAKEERAKKNSKSPDKKAAFTGIKKPLPDDSVSEITELDKQEILT